MDSVFPSSLITWPWPLRAPPKHLLFLLPITTAFVQNLVSSLGPCSPPAPGHHRIVQSHQRELENVGFDCAVSLSRMAPFLLPPYTMESKLGYGLLEAAALCGPSPGLAVSAALGSLASGLVDVLLLRLLWGRS